MTRTLSATLACTVAVLALPLLAWAAPCGNITYKGCCSGSTAKYCNKSGVLVTKDCTKDTKYGPNCGWVTSLSYYTCNKTVTKDPSGKLERDCAKQPTKPDAGVKKDTGTTSSCGNITYTGCCTGTTAKYCSSNKLMTKDCSKISGTPKCGWVAAKKFYSCTTSEGSDPAGLKIRDCAKQPAKPDAGVKKDTGTKKDTGSGPACGAVKSQGCCDGDTVKFCASNKLNTKKCSGAKPKCGWDSTKKYYTCGTTGKADPAGKYPMKCSGSTPKDSGVKKDTGGVKKDTGGIKKDTGATAKDSSTNTGGNDDDDDGCSVGGGSSSSLLLLALGLLLLVRRRV